MDFYLPLPPFLRVDKGGVDPKVMMGRRYLYHFYGFLLLSTRVSELGSSTGKREVRSVRGPVPCVRTTPLVPLTLRCMWWWSSSRTGVG